MDRPPALIPLLCVKCKAPIPAGPEEVAWVCALCGQGQVLDEDNGLVSLDFHCLPGIAANSRGKPFWVVEGKVSLERSTYSGNRAAEAAQYWSEPRLFFIPAFSTGLDAGLELANRLLLSPPALQEGPPAAFEPVVIASGDVRPLVEFLIISVEAGRKDTLKELRFQVSLGEPALWVLP
jgi:hypothetical protein